MYRPEHQKPWITDSTRFLANLILWVLLIGVLLVLAFGVGYWMMSIWHNA